MGRRALYFAVAAAVLLLDQVSKRWAAAVLGDGTDIDVIDGFFRLTYAENPGIAFSFFNSGASTTRWALAFVSTAAAVTIAVFMLRMPAYATRLQATFGMLLGGVVGNLVDRVETGRVIDFIDVYYASHHWPTFNVADSAITVGAVLLAYDLLVSPSVPVESEDAHTGV